MNSQSNVPRPGRHRNPDEPDDVRAAAGTGVGAAYDDDADLHGAHSAAAPVDSGGGMPLRGLAMICIFIGVCLMGWGLYAWTSGGDDSGDGSEGGDTVAEAPADDAGDRPAGEQPAVAPDGRPDAGAPPAAPAPGASEAPGAPAAPAPGAEGEIRRADFPVTVLNNSPEPGLASGVSDDLAAEGWGRGETGNAPEGQYGVWQETTVHYTEGNDAERAAAEEIARERGWRVEPRRPEMADVPGGIVVVTAVDARG